MSETQRVNIVGGTFALGAFVLAIAINSCGIDQKLGRLVDAMERAHPTAEPTK